MCRSGDVNRVTSKKERDDLGDMVPEFVLSVDRVADSQQLFQLIISHQRGAEQARRVILSGAVQMSCQSRGSQVFGESHLERAWAQGEKKPSEFRHIRRFGDHHPEQGEPRGLRQAAQAFQAGIEEHVTGIALQRQRLIYGYSQFRGAGADDFGE